MRVVLTGCDGFIGRNIHSELLKTKDISSVVCIEKDYMNHSDWYYSV